MSGNAFDREEQKDKFARLFGVTEEELINRGIDPSDYARRNIRNALKNQGNWDLVLPNSNQYGILLTRWGLRGFVAMFIGVGFLAVSKYQTLHLLGLYLAYAMLLAALVAYVFMLKYRRMYIATCGDEKVVLTWRRNKPGRDCVRGGPAR
ncbi:MAG TPA: hypothetical protein VIJ86_05645 [Acidimicrobiales bacterium]